MQGVPRTLPDCFNQASLAEVSQFRTKKEYCSQSRPTGTSLTTLAGHFRPLGERCLLEAKRKAPRYPLLSTGSKSCPRPN
jgi:hypothetical protein